MGATPADATPADGTPADGTPGGAPAAEDRLAALEAAVVALRAEVAALRTAAPVAAAPAVGAPPVAPPPLTYATLPPAARPAPRGPSAAPSYDRRAGVLDVAPPGDAAPGATRFAIETLVGRYGALAVGALVVLMAVGAFLKWAAENFTLLPAARVALGALGAAALAAFGERLRRRPGSAQDGTRRYGEVLLALALAVVHVDAWAAGPYLHVVGTGVALGAAALASAALTALAWRARHQSLFVVGVGGALFAPFVTGAGEVQPLVRPVYGWVVLTAGLLALRQGGPGGAEADGKPGDSAGPSRPWVGAGWLLALGTTGYALAQLDAGVGGAPPRFTRDLPAAFALACAAGPLAAALWSARRTARRPVEARTDARAGTLVARLALADLATALVAIVGAAVGAAARAPSLAAYAFAATLAAHALAHLPAWTRDGRAAFGFVPEVVFAALILPVALLAAALAALGEFGTAPAGGVAALWGAVSAAAAAHAWRGGDRARVGPHVAAAGLATALVPAVAVRGHDALRATLLGLHTVATSIVFTRLPGRTPERDARSLLPLLPPFLTVVAATVWAGILLVDRPAYAYVPFLTAPSAAAAAAVAGWTACAVAVWRAGDELLPRSERAGVVWFAAAAALFWGHLELRGAVAPDVSTVLLVGYYALAGVGVLAFGRARGVAAARQAGLGLALFAAFKAVVEVSQLGAVALRVGSYLLVGGFLLGVGYWYRRGAEAEGSGPPHALPRAP